MAISRKKMIETAVQAAKDMGWESVKFEDDGKDVMIVLNAPGAAEQMTEPCRLPTLVRAVRNVGPAADYPAIEEYPVRYDESMPYEGHEDPREQYVQPVTKWDEVYSPPEDRPGDYVEEEAFPPEHYGPEKDPFTVDAAVEISEAESHADEPTELEKPEPDDDPFAGLEVPAEIVEVATEPLPEKEEAKVAKKRARRASESRDDLIARCKALGITGYSRLNVKSLRALIRNVERNREEIGRLAAALDAAEQLPGPIEDVSGHGIEPPTIKVSPKMAATEGDVFVQDRGGIAHPEQIFPQEETTVNLSAETVEKLGLRDEMIDLGEGRCAIARHGNDTKVFSRKISASLKTQMEGNGWKFFNVTGERARELLRNKRKAAGMGTAPVAISHKRGEDCVERLNGRVYAKPGYMFRLSLKSDPSVTNEFATINEAVWRKLWNIAVVYVGV